MVMGVRWPRQPVSSFLTGALNMRGLVGEGQPVIPKEERERQRAEYEAQRCSECGCHPEEHGEY